jgi:hypothetical protein
VEEEEAMKPFDIAMRDWDNRICPSLVHQLRASGFGVRVVGRGPVVITCYDPLGESPELPRGFTKKDILAW